GTERSSRLSMDGRNDLKRDLFMADTLLGNAVVRATSVRVARGHPHLAGSAKTARDLYNGFRLFLAMGKGETAAPPSITRQERRRARPGPRRQWKWEHRGGDPAPGWATSPPTCRACSLGRWFPPPRATGLLLLWAPLTLWSSPLRAGRRPHRASCPGDSTK